MKYYGSFPSGWKNTYVVKAYNTDTEISNSGAYSAYETFEAKRTVTNQKVGYVYWHWMYNAAYSEANTRPISPTPYSGSWAFQYFYAFAHTTDAPFLDTSYQPQNTGLKCYNCSSILPQSAKINAADGGAGTPRHFRFEYYSSTYTDYQKMFRWEKITQEESTTQVVAGGEISDVQEWVKYRAK